MKCDITLSRGQTVNIGNWSNVKPNISMTLKDVDTEVLNDKYSQLSNLVSCLLGYETKTALEEMKLVSHINSKCDNYVISLESFDFSNEIDELISELNK